MKSGKSKYSKPKVGVIGLKGLPAFGGSARAGENMMFYLKDEFHFVVFNTDTHTFRKTGVYDGVEQIVYKKFFIGALNTIYYYLRATWHCLLAGDFDVIHVFHVDAAFIVPLLRLRFRVVSGHRARPQFAAKWSWPVRQYFRFMEWLFFKMPADVVTTVNRPVAELFQTRTKRKILFIPNGIVFEEDAQLPDIDEKDYVLFASGRIMESKGAHLMLEALVKINYKGRVLVIGNRSHSPEYARKLDEISQALDVRFIDIIKDKSLLMAYLKNARLFVFPSYHEGMSNMLLEAASAQVPLICSDIPGNRQVFDDSEAFFFQSGNSDDLAQKMTFIFKDEAKAIEVARKAYRKLKNEYNWEKLAQRYAQIYRWMIEHKKPLNRRDQFPELRGSKSYFSSD
ncbi:glycosyltransferase family 4 protein [Thermophagus sp. OGC60D27]|uniref:glycosyltransferase family 4 protein n=1 Tax=Thermophagus sp. OGC60D27 TaxID=3458415 RepID=UPI004037ACAA